MDLQLPPDFKEFLKLLKVHGVRYLLIGESAVGYHSYPRATDPGSTQGYKCELGDDGDLRVLDSNYFCGNDVYSGVLTDTDST